jgi:hypothetical protein
VLRSRSSQEAPGWSGRDSQRGRFMASSGPARTGSRRGAWRRSA